MSCISLALNSFIFFVIRRTNTAEQSKGKSLADEGIIAADREYEAHRYHTATNRYTECIRLNSNSPQLYARRAECHLMLGDYDLATEDAEKACSLDALCVAAISCLLRMGRIDKLEVIYLALDEKLIRCCMSHNNFNELKNLDSKIENFYKQKQFEECIRNIGLATQIADKCRKYQQMHVECLIMTFKYEEATEMIDQYFKKLKDQANKHFFLGLMHFVQGDFESSLKEFSESRKADPNFVRASKVASTSKKIYSFYCIGNYANLKRLLRNI